MAKHAKLSEAEMEVMQAVWQQNTPTTVTQLLAIFEEEKQWKTSTLSTLLARLIEKGFLRKEMQGKVNFYHIVITYPMYQQQETRSLLTNVFGGSVPNLMAALVEETLTPQDVQELTQWLHAKAGKHE
jgi:BlaI family penicillinase repressor